jgi:hypothetical protein
VSPFSVPPTPQQPFTYKLEWLLTLSRRREMIPDQQAYTAAPARTPRLTCYLSGSSWPGRPRVQRQYCYRNLRHVLGKQRLLQTS